MTQTEHYRHELKYQVDYGSYLALRSRLQSVMHKDPHAGPNGCYTVYSVYFDNWDDKALREKVNGIQTREKFRLRWYNGDLSFLTLEKKRKHNSLCQKLSAPLTEEEGRLLLAGERDWMARHPNGLVRELYAKATYQGLCPRVIVSYRREPYVYGPGNVRVTFDSNVRTSLCCSGFPTPGARALAVEGPGHLVLEVKYDSFLPEILSLLLQTEGVRQSAFSKYAACRRYG